MTLIDLISLSLLFRTGAKGKGTWDFKLQLPVAGSFVSEFRLGPPSGIKPYDVQDQDEDADDEDEDDDLMAGFAKKQHGASKKKTNQNNKRRRLVK